jgi:hypothetical protein
MVGEGSEPSPTMVGKPLHDRKPVGIMLPSKSSGKCRIAPLQENVDAN